jgi:hypothetical protein
VAVRFAGSITPQAETLRRLLRAMVVEAVTDGPWPTLHPEIAAFAARLRSRVEPN